MVLKEYVRSKRFLLPDPHTAKMGNKEQKESLKVGLAYLI